MDANSAALISEKALDGAQDFFRVHRAADDFHFLAVAVDQHAWKDSGGWPAALFLNLISLMQRVSWWESSGGDTAWQFE